ncbi:hypothetical protein [Sodalis-like endosymbiont of Proechinophthirus fluctus]|uniref:hypothetical protein n=1 Tax=Sodalis-like endosymbiont of Proechinophthirus fluctus TaxID=1462730 RepID=UPI000B276DE2|nr:hypothetical protein [Sodalis-like endosymbiont of Proechinophthirus fluctus]
MGTGSLLAATVVKDTLAALGIKDQVCYYSCRAEEIGSPKGVMGVRAWVFDDDVNIAISWHPVAFTGVSNPIFLACNELNFHFSSQRRPCRLLFLYGPLIAGYGRTDERRRQLSARAYAVNGTYSTWSPIGLSESDGVLFYPLVHTT